jgi:MinD-like ATPase involved in chromosome partitioning or flagellar assembly
MLDKTKKISKNAHSRLESLIAHFRPSLIINGYRNSEDEMKGLAVIMAAKRMLNITVQYIGYQHYDKSVQESVKAGHPFIVNSKGYVTRDCMRIIKNGIIETIPGKTALKAFKENAEVLKQEGMNPAICTYDCQYWDQCEFKKGGYPCVVRKL